MQAQYIPRDFQGKKTLSGLILKMVVKFSMDPETSVDFLTRKQAGEGFKMEGTS